MPFPRFMLMRGSLRGNGNQCWTTHWSKTKLLPPPALPGGMCCPIGTAPGCITCVLGITHPHVVLAADLCFGESVALLWNSVGKIIGNKLGFPG